MRKLLPIILILTSFISNSQDFEINGYVVDTITNKPMPYVNVFYKIDTIPIGGTMTDKTGYFEIKNIKQKEIVLISSFIGYLSFSKKIILNNKNNKEIIKLTSYENAKPDRYIINGKDTIYFYSLSYNNDWIITSIDHPSVKKCGKKLCNGLVQTFYITGEIQEVGFFKNGKIINSEYKSFYKNGNVKSIGNILNGNRVGQWLFYNKNGSIEIISFFDKNGNVISIYEFSLDGILIDYVIKDVSGNRLRYKLEKKTN